MADTTNHERMVSRLRNGVGALAGHIKTTSERVETYMAPPTTPPADVESQS